MMASGGVVSSEAQNHHLRIETKIYCSPEYLSREAVREPVAQRLALVPGFRIRDTQCCFGPVLFTSVVCAQKRLEIVALNSKNHWRGTHIQKTPAEMPHTAAPKSVSHSKPYLLFVYSPAAYGAYPMLKGRS